MMFEMSEHINDLAAALAKAQAEIKPAAKDATNPHFKSKYAGLPAVWDACRAQLSSNGLSVAQLPIDSGEGRVGLRSMLLHSSGQYIACTYSTKLQQDNAQGVGSALTYLRRYGLAALIGVVADDDDDGNAASQRQSAGPATYAAPAGQPATNGNGGVKASEKQIKMLFAIWSKNGYEGKLSDWIQEAYHCAIDDLTIKQASAAIETLQPKEEAAA